MKYEINTGVKTLIENRIIARGCSECLEIECDETRVRLILAKHSDIVSDVLCIQKTNKPLDDLELLNELIKGGL